LTNSKNHNKKSRQKNKSKCNSCSWSKKEESVKKRIDVRKKKEEVKRNCNKSTHLKESLAT